MVSGNQRAKFKLTNQLTPRYHLLHGFCFPENTKETGNGFLSVLLGMFWENNE